MKIIKRVLLIIGALLTFASLGLITYGFIKLVDIPYLDIEENSKYAKFVIYGIFGLVWSTSFVAIGNYDNLS